MSKRKEDSFIAVPCLRAHCNKTCFETEALTVSVQKSAVQLENIKARPGQ